MPAPPKINPLTEDHLAVANRVLQHCDDYEDFLNHCNGCEMDVQEAKDRVAANRRFCQAVKREFFPDRP